LPAAQYNEQGERLAWNGRVTPALERRCTRCNATHPETPTHFRFLTRQSRYHPHCRECERIHRRERQHALPRRTRVARGVALGTDRRFGIEIEFFGIRRETAKAALIEAGLRVSASNRTKTKWRIRADGSVNGQGCHEGGSGLEAVSPPMKGTDGLNQARLALQALRVAGAQIDRSCGLHVHLEVADIRLDGIKWFCRSWYSNQELIHALVPRSRRMQTSGFCRRLGSTHIRQIENDFDGRYGAPLGRYWEVNVHSFPKYGTLEIRLHSGTLNFSKTEAWIKMLMGMMDACKAAEAPIAPHEGLHHFFETIGLEAPMRDRMYRRAERFGYARLVQLPAADHVGELREAVA
jgi:hypothetical protein